VDSSNSFSSPLILFSSSSNLCFTRFNSSTSAILPSSISFFSNSFCSKAAFISRTTFPCASNSCSNMLFRDCSSWSCFFNSSTLWRCSSSRPTFLLTTEFRSSFISVSIFCTAANSFTSSFFSRNCSSNICVCSSFDRNTALSLSFSTPATALSFSSSSNSFCLLPCSSNWCLSFTISSNNCSSAAALLFWSLPSCSSVAPCEPRVFNSSSCTSCSCLCTCSSIATFFSTSSFNCFLRSSISPMSRSLPINSSSRDSLFLFVSTRSCFTMFSSSTISFLCIISSSKAFLLRSFS